MDQYEKLKSQLEEQLLLISKETNILSQQAKLSIPICVKTLEDLKSLVNKKNFKSEKEEIFFFKYFKPQIAGKLIYFVQLFNIDTLKPIGTEEQIRKYFCDHLKTINQFKDDNVPFYQYYRSDSSFLDEKYFIRSKYNLHFALDYNSANYDTTFNTSHDQKAAQIIAYDLLQKYLHNQLNRIERSFFSENSNTRLPSNLKWTDNKIKLIELIYALHSAKCINSGTAELSEIASVFEKVFDVELNDYYRKYLEIKDRKGQPTKFLDQLKNALNDRINIDLQ